MKRTGAMHTQLMFGESLYAGRSLIWDEAQHSRLRGRERGRAGGGRFIESRMGREGSGVPRQHDI
jgi:hypothetical protein